VPGRGKVAAPGVTGTGSMLEEAMGSEEVPHEDPDRSPSRGQFGASGSGVSGTWVARWDSACESQSSCSPSTAWNAARPGAHHDAQTF
jgi:hypothetical protein